MRKIFYLASVAALTLPIFAGCKNNSETSAKEIAPKPTTEITVSPFILISI